LTDFNHGGKEDEHNTNQKKKNITQTRQTQIKSRKSNAQMACKMRNQMNDTTHRVRANAQALERKAAMAIYI